MTGAGGVSVNVVDRTVKRSSRAAARVCLSSVRAGRVSGTGEGVLGSLWRKRCLGCFRVEARSCVRDIQFLGFLVSVCMMDYVGGVDPWICCV